MHFSWAVLLIKYYYQYYSPDAKWVTSASLTHMIKMTEPLFTALISACMGRISFSSDIILMMMTVLISALGSEPLSSAPASMIGLTFSVGSNLCFALRNIGHKAK